MTKCQSKTATGAPCRMATIKGGRYCFNHSPAAAADRAAARRAGGQARHTPHAGDPEAIPARIVTIEDARALLDYVKLELLAMDNGIQRNRALIALHEGYVRSLEIGELEARIAALEALRK